MTVTYSLNVANARLTGFTKLLLRWKGSIYKLLYREVVIFCGLYYMLSMSYRYLLSASQKLAFEKCVEYCRTFTSVIPLSFVLGFYVSIVVTRWWQQFMQIPWPDKAVLLISGYVRGDDERGRIIRRTLARYLVLMQVLTFQAVSTSVRRRFPTLDHIQEVGLFTPEERLAYDEIVGTHGKWWAPAQWFISLVIRARRAGRIKHDYLMDKIIDELHVYRTCCGMMFAYDWISIPLVYTQTVSIATYMYFVAAMIGRQYLDPRPDQRTTSNDVDYYIPIFTILEFLCFMGWLKVAEQLINPYGEDDDDFELNWCLDRNLLVSFTIVDEMYNKHPKLVPDIFWDKREPFLPYTKSSLNPKMFNAHPHLGSTIDLNIEPEEFILPMETIMEEDREDYNYSSPPSTGMVDFTNTQPNWFQNQPSVIQMDNDDVQDQTNRLLNTSRYPPSSKYGVSSNVSRNHSELIEGLKAENSSRNSSRSGGILKRILPNFIKETKLGSKLTGQSSQQPQQQQPTLPTHQYQNYSNLRKHAHFHHQHSQSSQQSPLPDTFLLRTPTKKQRKQQPSLSINESTNRLNQPNQSLLVTSTPYSMNPSSNASVGNLNLNAMHNNFNTSLSTTTVSGQNLSHQNLSHQNLTGTISTDSQQPIIRRNKQQFNKKLELDDLTSSNDDQRFEKDTRNHHNLRLNRTPTTNQPLPANKYGNLPTAPVLPCSSSSAANKNRTSPFMSRLRNSLNFSSNHYRNFPTFGKLGSRNKRNSFSSAISLKSKCDNPTSDQLVSREGGFHFPQSYVPSKNLNQYLPLHLKQSQNAESVVGIEDQENDDKFIDTLSKASNLNKPDVTIQISPASGASTRNLNSHQSLSNLKEEENLIVMEDLNNNNNKEPDDKNKSSSYTVSAAVEILESKNETELNKLKSSKPKVDNQDSQPLTSETLTANQSKTSTRSSSPEINPQDHVISNNENQILINKNEMTSSSSNETQQSKEQDNLQSADQQEAVQERYSPNEDCHEEKYHSPTHSISSNDSLSPYESNQNTVSSYTQLLEKDKNKEY